MYGRYCKICHSSVTDKNGNCIRCGNDIGTYAVTYTCQTCSSYDRENSICRYGKEKGKEKTVFDSCKYYRCMND